MQKWRTTHTKPESAAPARTRAVSLQPSPCKPGRRGVARGPILPREECESGLRERYAPLPCGVVTVARREANPSLAFALDEPLERPCHVTAFGQRVADSSEMHLRAWYTQ